MGNVLWDPELYEPAKVSDLNSPLQYNVSMCLYQYVRGLRVVKGVFVFDDHSLVPVHSYAYFLHKSKFYP